MLKPKKTNPKRAEYLDSLDATMQDVEDIVIDMVTRVKGGELIKEDEFSQKKDLVKLVCNFHAYKTSKSDYLIAKQIALMSPEQQALLKARLERESL